MPKLHKKENPRKYSRYNRRFFFFIYGEVNRLGLATDYCSSPSNHLHRQYATTLANTEIIKE